MFSRNLLLLAVLGLAMQVVAAQELVLAVKGDTTYQEGGPVPVRYKPLLDLLEKELKHPVRVQSIEHYGEMQKGMAAERYDLVFIDPALIALRAVKSGKYVGVVTAKGFTDYSAHVMVKKDSPLQTMEDLRGKKIGVPSMDSNATVMFTASLVELGFTDPAKNFTATRYQDAVPFMVQNGFVDAGVAASGAVVKDWLAKGGRVIGETKPIPVKQLLASRKLSAEDREKIQAVMLKLTDSATGKQALKGMDMKGFVPWNDAVMADASKRLGL